MTESKLGEQSLSNDLQSKLDTIAKDAVVDMGFVYAGDDQEGAAMVVFQALRQATELVGASESRPAGIEPRGCPVPGACMCHPDAVAKAVETERWLTETRELMAFTLERERTAVCDAANAIRKALDSRRWLTHGHRGSFAYDDDKFFDEFKGAVDETDAAMEPLSTIASDWSNCPKEAADIVAARARATSPSPPFDEAAERAAFESVFDTGPEPMFDDMRWTGWLASAQRRRV